MSLRAASRCVPSKVKLTTDLTNTSHNAAWPFGFIAVLYLCIHLFQSILDKETYLHLPPNELASDSERAKNEVPQAPYPLH
jgi:hypothetical protein